MKKAALVVFVLTGIFLTIYPCKNARAAQADGGGKKVGKADITGIIYGGATGCLYGAAGGTVVVSSVGTLAGCAALGSTGAITGGLGNSAKAALNNFVDWLTS